MRILLHPGSYKTGTSFLQAAIQDDFAAHGDAPLSFHRNGCHFLKQSAEYVGFWRNLYCGLRNGQRGNELLAREQLRRLIGSFPDDATLILSDENLLLGQLGLEDAALYPRVGAVASFFAAALDGHDVRVVFSFRRQDGFVESNYANIVKHGYDKPFFRYLQEIELERLHWSRPLSAFAGSFGEQRVHAFPLEAIAANDVAFLRQFSEIFLPGTPLQRSPGRCMESLSEKALRVCRAAAPVLGPEERFALGVLLQQSSFAGNGPRARYLPDLFRDELVELYAEDNRQVFERYVPAPWQALFEATYATGGSAAAARQRAPRHETAATAQ